MHWSDNDDRLLTYMHTEMQCPDWMPCLNYIPKRNLLQIKSPTVAIKQSVIDQIIRYNMVLKVRYLVVSNGMQHFCCRIDFESGNYTYLNEIPMYDSII